MVYDSDFYTTRRVGSSYTRPTISSYTVTTPRYSSYTTSSDVGAPRRDESSYSYSKTVRSETSSASGADPYSSRPSTSTSTYSSTSERNSRGGPGGYSYNTERTTTTGGGPGGYSYSSTTSGRLPYGTSYRHYSYRV